MLTCFYDYRFPPEMQKAFDGADRFFPINYKTTWEVVRDVAKGSGGRLRQGDLRQGNQARGRRSGGGKARKRRAVPASLRQPLEVVCRRQACPDRHQPRDRGARNHGDHRAVGHRQEHADPLHQPAGRADRRARSCSTDQDLAQLSAPALRQARRHIGMVFQEYNLVERLTVMENLLSGAPGLRVVVARVAAQVSARRYPQGLRAARRRRAVVVSRTAAPMRCRAASASASASRAP